MPEQANREYDMAKKINWAKKLKLNVKKELLKIVKQSPAGRRFLKSLDTKKISPAERRVRQRFTKAERKSMGI